MGMDGLLRFSGEIPKPSEKGTEDSFPPLGLGIGRSPLWTQITLGFTDKGMQGLAGRLLGDRRFCEQVRFVRLPVTESAPCRSFVLIYGLDAGWSSLNMFICWFLAIPLAF